MTFYKNINALVKCLVLSIYNRNPQISILFKKMQFSSKTYIYIQTAYRS